MLPAYPGSIKEYPKDHQVQSPLNLLQFLQDKTFFKILFIPVISVPLFAFLSVDMEA